MRISPSLVRVVWLLLALWTEVCQCSGYLELQLVGVENAKGELASGECCVGSRGQSDDHCGLGDCETYFRACLKEYQAEISATGPCTYGSASTQVIGGKRSATNLNSISDAGTLHIPFEFAWPRAFTLTLEAWHWDNHTLRASEELLIQRLTYKAAMDPGEELQVLHLHGDTASVELNLSVRCHKHYYGNKCNKQCRPRDDYFGHYGCDANGNRECVEGWTGQDCTTAVCKPGCNPPKGRCDVPGECKCKVGWQGPLCEECVPYPGCKYGTCVEPWQCRCNKDWGGMLCDRDLNYCGSHQPCRNGGICRNPVPGEYSCQCPQGYSGRNCENDSRNFQGRCQNGGTCQEGLAGRVCVCVVGFGGQYCEQSESVCDSEPCMNGGRCHHTPSGYSCQCPPGYSGHTCQVQADVCVPSPCLNGGVCHRLHGDFYCTCPLGYEGKTCSSLQVIDSCTIAVTTNSTEGVWQISSNVCGSHGHCISQSRGNFTCACQPGFTGKYCHEMINSSCDSAPCLNGGTCVGGGAYTCICKEGWEGPTCAQNVNDCISHPCYNGGVCVDGESWFRCECAPGFAGPDCRISVDVGSVCVLADGTVSHGFHWDQECNVCQCVNGDVRCTQVYCGPRPCLLEGFAAVPQRPLCAGGQRCVPHASLSCLRPPCHQWGICLPPRPPAPPHTPCQPNSPHQDHGCARVTLVLDRGALPQGSTVEGVCSELRYLPIMRSLAQNHTLLILCDQSHSHISAVEVAMSYVRHEHPKIQEVMRTVIAALSKRYNSTLLLAIREVNIQTPVLSPSREVLRGVIPFAPEWIAELGTVRSACGHGHRKAPCPVF
ncbi:protein jagged-2-like [Alosa alosa]|uniref:protein jagged-2-like n=1 Tax=Alosa alosa TaxID=278164 RepID=UPI002015317A|nr:protein jagged-2-like [Alosa alosa]